MTERSLAWISSPKDHASHQIHNGVSGLVVKSIVAIDGPRVRFAADALSFLGPSEGSRLFLPLFDRHENITEFIHSAEKGS